MNKLTLSFAFAIGLMLAVPCSFAAGNASQEIATAAAHAQMAAAAADRTTADMHLHHAINCLVGSSDKRYDAQAGDPCKGKGNGAIHDLGHAPAEHVRLQQALMQAERGLHADSLDATHAAAKRAAEALKASGPNDD
ncbi:MAG TPA: hypothetical protein VJS16_04895 [Gammaproteobacteria bacterium]|nr:hypothetical protein [Gammaproteobacteria bacterium]